MGPELELEPDARAARFPLAADLIDPASSVGDVILVEELRGLSPLFPPPGIRVRNAVFNDLVDSLVSDLLNEGYEDRSGPEPVGVCEPDGVPVPFPSFDPALPILISSYRGGFRAVECS